MRTDALAPVDRWTAAAQARARPWELLPRALLPAVRWLAVALLVTAALVLAARRAGHALDVPLPAAALLTVGVAAALLLWLPVCCEGGPRADKSAASRKTGESPAGPESTVERTGRLAARVPAAASVVVVGFSLMVPGTSLAAAALFWAPVVVGQVLVLQPWGRDRAGRRLFGAAERSFGTAPQRPIAPDSSRAPEGTATQPAEGRHVEGRQVEGRHGEQRWQQIVRLTDGTGRDTVRGWCRLSFEAGQRLATAHVAFCPPLERLPQVACRQSAGPSARVSLVQVLPHGVRFDAKLSSAPTAATSIEIDFTAQAADTAPAANAWPVPAGESSRAL